jgi:homoserine kinase type II
MHGKDGQALRRIKNKLSALVTFLDGVSPKKPTANQCRALGAAMAQMHVALADFPLSRPNALGAASWAKLFENRRAAADNLKAGEGDRVSADLQFLAGNWPANLPQGVIHADLFPDNALFIGDRLGGIIDFYFACTDALAYDLAISLNSWCFEPSGEYNLTKGQAMIAGYESVRPLNADERAALPILARGAAMRFFLTRLVDWDSTPPGALVRPKNPLEYAARLAFHRAAAGPGDYGA